MHYILNSSNNILYHKSCNEICALKILISFSVVIGTIFILLIGMFILYKGDALIGNVGKYYFFKEFNIEVFLVVRQ